MTVKLLITPNRLASDYRFKNTNLTHFLAQSDFGTIKLSQKVK